MTSRILNAPLPVGSPHVQVAIVGAGACGLTAALMLKDAGVDCVVLERDATPSGSTALSSGFIPAAATLAQKAQRIEDNALRFAADIQAKAHGNAATHLVTAYATASGAALDALQTRYAIEFEVLDSFLYPGHSICRMHCVPEKTGAALMARLLRAAAKTDVPIVTHALVQSLYQDSTGRITGLNYVRPDGHVDHLGCDVILLACNGFGGNAAMVNELLPDMRGALFAGHRGNDGSAIEWGRGLGARLADLGAYQGHGSWAVPHGALISWAVMMEGGIQVNTLGKRFHDESQGYSEAAVNVLAQPGGVAWNVFDDAILTLARGFPDFCEAQDAGAVKTCADVAALSALIGCPATTLQGALNETAMVPGTPANATGRVFKRELRPPFHAVKVTGALFHTQGGLDIDAQCRVLRDDGAPHPNLLAAGGAARGVSGDAVWGYLSGNGLLSAVAGGYIAAQTATELIHGRSVA